MGKIPKDYDGWEAYGYLFSSLVYLLKHPQYGIVLYFIISLGGGRFIWNEVSHFTGVDVQVSGRAKAVDIQEDGSFNVPPHFQQRSSSFSLIPEAFAQDATKSRTWNSPNAIVFDKQFFDFSDERFALAKKEGEDKFLIYFRPTKVGIWWDADEGMFDPELYKK